MMNIIQKYAARTLTFLLSCKFFKEQQKGLNAYVCLRYIYLRQSGHSEKGDGNDVGTAKQILENQ